LPVCGHRRAALPTVFRALTDPQGKSSILRAADLDESEGPNMTMLLTDAARLLLFPTVMAFAASSDLFTMTISNRISIILIAAFLALAVATGMPPREMLDHASAGGLVLAVTFTFFLCGWVGGGDAKLAAATALWLGWAHLFDYLLYASLLGGVLTLALIEFRKFALPRTLIGKVWAERLHQPGGGVPYGIALAIAALVVYPSTIWMQTLGH
jgi:prepilin peptidase CpaA